MPIEQLKPIIEAALLAASQPLSLQQLTDLFTEEEQVEQAQVKAVLESLTEDCAGRGVELREVASGFRYQVRQDVHPWISRMWTEKPSRYSRALLETLALIAYRQPITRPEIEQIRGVVVSSNIIKTLEEREWIRVVGYRDVPGKPALFGTTRAFLDYFNLKSLDELPPLSEIRELEDPQMRLDQEPLPVRVARDLPIDPDEVGAAETAANDDEHQADAANQHPDDGTPGREASAHDADAASPQTAETESTAAATHTSVDAAAATITTTTADEAASQAEANTGDAEQDSEEHRA